MTISVDFHLFGYGRNPSAKVNTFDTFAALQIESGDGSISLYGSLDQVEAMQQMAEIFKGAFSAKPDPFPKSDATPLDDLYDDGTPL